MKKRVIALLLCAVMLVTCMGVGIFAPPDIKLVDAESGEAVSAIAIPQSERVRIATDYESTNEIGYQWQLSTDGKTWINIYGQTGESIQLSYAMICNMLSDEGTAQVRCVVTDGDSEYETREAELSVDYSAPARPAQAAKAPVSVAPVSDPAPVSEGEDPELFNICINYIYGSGSKRSGEPASEQSVATVSYGGNFTEKVTFPTVVGYAAYFEDATEPSTEHQFNLENITKNQTFNVYYQPATVNYTVKYFLQNLEDDEYTVDASRTKVLQGTTEQLVPDNLSDKIAGFTSLLYERTEIAADGSTEIEIYYDRNYCLLSFDLDGGWGVEPIYARYGTPISIDQTALKKTGYTFDGWETLVPSKMPAENTICKAKWKQDDTAKVTVVIWGENADDENYSYQRSFQIEAEPGTELTQTDLNGKLACGMGEHTHSASCGLNCTHTSHDLSCYGNLSVSSISSDGDGDAEKHYNDNCTDRECKGKTSFKQHLKNGSVCQYKNGRKGLSSTQYFYYLYWDGVYYEINAAQYSSLKSSTGFEHTHGRDTYYVYEGNGSCLSCSHVHDDSCYTCGKEVHTHDASCYYNANTMDSKLWELVKSDPVTVAADGTTVMNLYYDRKEFTLTFKYNYSRNQYQSTETVTAKWGADIGQDFLSKSKNANGSLWSRTEDGGEPWTSYLQIMPSENRTYYCKNTSSTVQPAQYWVENQTAGQFSLQYTVNAYYGRTLFISEEDIYDIVGFTFSYGITSGNNRFTREDVRNSSPSFAWKDAKFYYTRNSYELSFYNYDRDLTDKTESVQYQAALSSYNFEPEYPSTLEAGAYKFDGWYTTAGCYAESKVNFGTQTMPAADMMLYAHWVPKSYEVKVWLDSDQSSIIQVNGKNSQTVTHGNFASAPEKTPVNGAWDFIGWFYKDAQGNEKAFDFKNIPVKQNLDIYAKWGSKQPREFTVYYKALIDGTEVEIANSTKGSAIPGKTKTFYAKTGDNLNEAYREAFFPDASSKSLTVDVDPSKNVVIFWYTQKDAVPYTVKYVYENGTNVFPDKVVEDNRKVVVTENALKKLGYLPDAIQKTLILSAEGPNVIKFVYKADTQHAYYTRTHYLEDVNGNFTIKRDYFEAVGDVGTTYSIEPNKYTGFTYDEGHTGEVKSGKLTQDGLDLELYYTRNSYPYTVRYLDKDTLKAVAPTEKRDAVKYGKQVTETAITIPGYTVDVSQKNAIISTDEGKNVITFYYTENTATINYVAVGAGVAEGICSVSNGSESVKVITGVPDGSTATINGNDPTYKFVGWYSDANCEHKVSDGYSYVPEKNSDGMYEAATYYAKFEYNLTSMTLRKEVTGGAYDANDMFIFTIKDSKGNVFAKVTVTAGQEVTISGLTVGEEYTITEDNNWSWRYDNHADVKIVMEPNAADNDVTVTNTLNTNKWLGASSYAINKCVDTISYRINEFFAKLIG